MAETAAENLAGLMSDGLTSVSEAGRFLGLSRTTLYELMDTGELPYCKIGGARRVPRRALVELAERALVGRASATA
jgi:excisionase family DNA binding protein